MPEHPPPGVNVKAFACPHCLAFSQMKWGNTHNGHVSFDNSYIAICSNCQNFSLWVKNTMVYPKTVMAAPAHPDMPADVLMHYNEARQIASESPKGAAALLRLAIEVLLPHFEVDAVDINNGIKELVAKGLPTMIQQALDSVRVIGNEAVHPGQIKLEDSPEMATALFDLVNLIIENRIAEPKRVQAIFDKLPDPKKKGIEERDKPKTETRA